MAWRGGLWPAKRCLGKSALDRLHYKRSSSTTCLGELYAGTYAAANMIREGSRAEDTDPLKCCYALCVLQKHGLKLHLRNPYSFTPMLEEGMGSKVPRSLLLGTDMAENQKQIAQFSRKDAQVGKGTSKGSPAPSPACRWLLKGAGPGWSHPRACCPKAMGAWTDHPTCPGRAPVCGGL